MTTTTPVPAFYGDGEPDWLPRRVVQARLGLSESRTIELISELGRFHSWRRTERGALEVAGCCVESEAGGELCARCCGEDGERCARGHRP